MNIIEIFGHMGSDPETRHTANNHKVTTFRMATNTKKGGKDVTIWRRVTLWGDRFDKMLQYLKKGSAVIVVGEMQPPEMYTSRDGTQQVSLEIWAEMVKFSPFGKSARAEGEQQEGASGAAPGRREQSMPAASYQESYEDSAGFGGGEGEKGSLQASGYSRGGDNLPF